MSPEDNADNADNTQRAASIDAQIISRAVRAGVAIQPAIAAQLAAYVALLAKWNRTINLTALPVDPPSDAAIDRLIVEPVAAARLVRPEHRRAIDIGSGGGSPAIPFNLAAPQLQFTLVEVKSRKSAFLREAGRQLGISGLTVETCRAEELGAKAALTASADIVTLRAVRSDDHLMRAIRELLKPGGTLFWFGGASSAEVIGESVRAGFEFRSAEDTTSGLALALAV